jgi:hypothetical protein
MPGLAHFHHLCQAAQCHAYSRMLRGKIVRSHGRAARATTLARGARPTIEPGANVTGALAVVPVYTAIRPLVGT